MQTMIRRLLTRFVSARYAPTGTAPARLCLTVALGMISLAPPIAAGADALVTITGGADASGHNYTWTVTNHHTSPIVYLEFPHFRADMFHVPAGWAAETTNLVGGRREPDKPSVCIARAEPPNTGLWHGCSREFGMRVAPAGAPRGPGTVTVRFADGTENKVAGVELPEPPASSGKYIPLIGAGVIFAGWVIVRTLRGRQPATATPASQDHT